MGWGLGNLLRHSERKIQGFDDLCVRVGRNSLAGSLDDAVKKAEEIADLGFNIGFDMLIEPALHECFDGYDRAYLDLMRELEFKGIHKKIADKFPTFNGSDFSLWPLFVFTPEMFRYCRDPHNPNSDRPVSDIVEFARQSKGHKANLILSPHDLGGVKYTIDLSKRAHLSNDDSIYVGSVRRISNLSDDVLLTHKDSREIFDSVAYTNYPAIRLNEVLYSSRDVQGSFRGRARLILRNYATVVMNRDTKYLQLLAYDTKTMKKIAGVIQKYRSHKRYEFQAMYNVGSQEYKDQLQRLRDAGHMVRIMIPLARNEKHAEEYVRRVNLYVK